MSWGLSKVRFVKAHRGVETITPKKHYILTIKATIAASSVQQLSEVPVERYRFHVV